MGYSHQSDTLKKFFKDGHDPRPGRTAVTIHPDDVPEVGVVSILIVSLLSTIAET